MDLADRGHVAMAERYRLGAEQSGGDALETADGVLYANAIDFPVMLNAALPYPGGDPHALASEAREWFAARARGFSFFARTAAEDEAATRAGMHAIMGRYPAMVLRAPVPAPLVPEGVTLRRVTDEAAAR